jgi:hypothetical protein
VSNLPVQVVDIGHFMNIANDRNKDPYDLLLDIIDAEIQQLKDEKVRLIIQKKCKDNPDVARDILKVLEIVNNFEAQRKLYEENKD